MEEESENKGSDDAAVWWWWWDREEKEAKEWTDEKGTIEGTHETLFSHSSVSLSFCLFVLLLRAQVLSSVVPHFKGTSSFVGSIPLTSGCSRSAFHVVFLIE